MVNSKAVSKARGVATEIGGKVMILSSGEPQIRIHIPSDNFSYGLSLCLTAKGWEITEDDDERVLVYDHDDLRAD